MKEVYFLLKSLLTRKNIENKYELDSYNYFQLRMFIDSLSQNENFGKITNDEFDKIKSNQKINRSKSIDLVTIYKILKKFYPDLIDLLSVDKKRSEIYEVFNTLRNQDYRNYIDLMNSSSDFELDQGRIKFQYIYVTVNSGNYIMLLDDETFLESIDDLRLKKGLREFTNLGNIKNKQDQLVNQINEDLNFESCYV